MRGSKKHLLDLLDRGDYVQVMNELLADRGVSVTGEDARHPSGHHDPTEWGLSHFCRQYCHDWFDQGLLSGWWPGGQARPPMWDLISTCSVDGRQGILLVEAKAHEKECKIDDKKSAPSGSAQSRANHQKIIDCLSQAEAGLNQVYGGGFSFSIENHYQLANRVAHLWKLATCGIPVVLLYLGFTGDTYFKRDYLIDADHWQRVMGAYMQGVVPLDFPGRVVPLPGGGSACMLVKSSKCNAPSRCVALGVAS
jgi:hypothetical protein